MGNLRSHIAVLPHAVGDFIRVRGQIAADNIAADALQKQADAVQPYYRDFRGEAEERRLQDECNSKRAHAAQLSELLDNYRAAIIGIVDAICRDLGTATPLQFRIFRNHWLPHENQETAVTTFPVAYAELQAAVERERAIDTTTVATTEDEIFTEETLPAAFREGGKANGRPLVMPYLESGDWVLGALELQTAKRSPNNVQSVKVRIDGKQKNAYEYTTLAAFRRRRTIRECDDENAGH